MSKFVVTCIDPDTGARVYGDIPTSKSHASRWAKKNAEIYGGTWGVAPVEEAIAAGRIIEEG